MSTETGLFAGMVLDTMLAAYGQTRLEGETDWEFRKRTFPAVFAQSYQAAGEFFFAARMSEWEESHKASFVELFKSRPMPRDLKKFADRFPTDPSLARRTD